MNDLTRQVADSIYRQGLAERAQNAGTTPLTLIDGYVHVTCGGAASRGARPAYIAYCWQCDRTVPMQETRLSDGV